MRTTLNQWLRAELCQRQRLNPSYSLRSFARHCGVSPGHMSEILGDKRDVSIRLAKKIESHLGLKGARLDEWLTLAPRAPRRKSKPRAQLLQDDIFSVIADWYHFAILSALEIPSEIHDADSLASRFGLATYKVMDALARLERLKLVERKGDSYCTVASGELETSDGVASTAIQTFHRQILALASDRLQAIPPEERDFLAGTIAVDKKNLPRAKAALRRCRDELMAILEEGAPEDVYCLGIQLFPLTRRH